MRPGETALAFYTATNPSNNPIVGVSSYNVLPFEAGQYFVKIQCFCFEEQQLNPHEEVISIFLVYSIALEYFTISRSLHLTERAAAHFK